MHRISSRTHGILDYAMVVVLLALPRLFGWSDLLTTLFTAMAAGMLIYSLMTDYEMGACPAIELRHHRRLDTTVGMVLLIAALLFTEQAPWVQLLMGFLGLAEIGIARLTGTAVATEPVAEMPRVRARGV
jgi:hypothetical protein